MAVQLDENFFNDLGLSGATDAQKQALVQYVLDTLELQVGQRLAEELTDDQLDEFERIAASDDTSPEVIAQKQQESDEWLKKNCPTYQDIITEEFTKLKYDLSSNLDVILGKSAI